jgi:hypothetical protein
MKFKIHVALALAIVARPTSAWTEPEERAVHVSVLDQGGTPVSGLGTRDFVVREAGVEREVVRVSAATDPLEIALLVDTSQAIEPCLGEVRSALKSFSREIADRHRRALFALGEHPTRLTDYSTDPARLEEGIGRLFGRPGDGASVANAIIEVSRGMRQREAARPVVVLIAAEDPDLGDRDHQAVIDDLRETNATLHTFVLGKAGASMTLERRLQSLAAELDNQYLVIYVRPRTVVRSGTFDVGVKRSGLTVRTPSRDHALSGYQCR